MLLEKNSWNYPYSSILFIQFLFISISNIKYALVYQFQWFIIQLT